ncbi:MAG: prepilin peptidase [Candidatus Schekmanbacteria bacterium]|nr:prepilin peptidase [Candidatus Schekmanbacteria bacterium]
MELAQQWYAWRGVSGMLLDVGLFAFLLACGVTDFRAHKIYNKLTFPALFVAVALHGIHGGISGLGVSAAGFGSTFGIFILLWIVGAMGGGDLKFMSVVGAFFAFPLSLWAIFYALLGAGVTAVAVMIAERRLLETFRRIGRTVYTFVVPGLATELPSKEDSPKIPFAVGAGCGAVATWILAALGRLGPLR